MLDFFKKNIYLHWDTKHLIGWIFLIVLIFFVIIAWIYWQPIWSFILEIWSVLRDKNVFRKHVEEYGYWAPLVFIVFQIFQVMVSPIPGELVGVAGGYIFGWLFSLIYSTMGLSLGSLINFFTARVIGKTFIEKIIPSHYLSQIRFFMERQGIVASFIFFLIPGFPKDYLCYILGLTPMNWRIFIFISSIGRIPGTLMLSLQGAAVYQDDYYSFIWLILLSIVFILPVYFWREQIYHLFYKPEKNKKY